MNKIELEKYFTGNCSVDESREIEQWIDANLETEEFARLACEILENLPYSDSYETRKAYIRLRRRISSNCGFTSAPMWHKRLRYISAAAVALLLAIVGTYILTINLTEQETTGPVYADLVQQYTGRGTTRNIVLPDSTVVKLFADSRIIYDRNHFDKSRRIWLFGDAFFDVSHRDGATFEVKCLNTDIRVLGTSFEVLSHDADDNFEVSLYKGGVRLTPQFNGHSDTLRMNPGDVVRIDKLSGTITRHTVPWLDNDSDNVIYVGSTVNDILGRLERRYNKSIIFQDKSKKISETRLNLIYHPTDSLETVIEAICEFSNLEMSRQGEDIVLKQLP